MAKKRKKTARKSSKRGNKQLDQPRFELSTEAKREITAIVLITLAILVLLASIGVAGSLGRSSLNFLKTLIGLSAYLLPLALVLVAWVLFQPDRLAFKRNNLLGLVGFFAALSGILGVIMGSKPGGSFVLASLKQQGGLVGYGISQGILPVLNKPVAVIVLIAVLLICLVIAANTRIKTVWTKVREIFWKKSEDGTEGVRINDPSAGLNSKLPIRGTLKAEKGGDQKEAEALTISGDASWKLPPLDLLESLTSHADAGNVKENVSIIQNTLSQFGIEAAMEDVNIGPTVTQYTLKPASNVKLNKITGLDRNLALALAAQTIRIEAPIPGKSVVGIEVPNKKAAIVKLRDILASDEMKAMKSKLAFALGRDVSGNIVIADIEEMPHVLIAGATKAGKSVAINTLITTMLYRNAPSELKFIMVDPKRVELTKYDNIPHLLTPVISGLELEKTISSLKWAVAETERRYRLLQDNGVRNISEYNSKKGTEGMPYIVIIIDELNDLMSQAGKDMEALIVRLAQMGRAAGIHLVLATQRPDVNVITGVIKANVPARIALRTTSQVDSRTILDQAGAEKLLGYGDMLYLSPEFTKPKRIQGVFLETKEIEKVTDWLRKAGAPAYNEEVLAQSVRVGGRGGGGGGDFDGGDDDMFEAAVEVVMQRGRASASDLQRRLRVGYSRAARLMDMLEERGVIGPPDGARPREVLINSAADLAGDAGDTAE